MPVALENGLLKCMPQPFVTGNGLKSLQDACDLMAKGVSAKKLVVALNWRNGDEAEGSDEIVLC